MAYSDLKLFIDGEWLGTSGRRTHGVINPATGEVLVVGVMSIPPSNLYDGSCTLFPGEHPFIVKHSFVAYKFGHVVSAATLEVKVAAGEFTAKPLLDEKRFADVVEGLKCSPHVTPKIRRFFDAAT